MNYSRSIIIRTFPNPFTPTVKAEVDQDFDNFMESRYLKIAVREMLLDESGRVTFPVIANMIEGCKRAEVWTGQKSGLRYHRFDISEKLAKKIAQITGIEEIPSDFAENVMFFNNFNRSPFVKAEDLYKAEEE